MENTEHGGVERQQEQKFGKFECEYKDEKGDVVCVAKFEIVPEESADSKETTARPMLKSLKLEAIDESGQKKNIDVLAIANPRNFPIAILDEQGIHSFLAGHVNAPAPRNQINLAVLFHELGHGDQISEKKFQNSELIEKEISKLARKHRIIFKIFHSRFINIKSEETFARRHQINAIFTVIGKKRFVIIGIYRAHAQNLIFCAVITNRIQRLQIKITAVGSHG